MKYTFLNSVIGKFRSNPEIKDGIYYLKRNAPVVRLGAKLYQPSS